MNTFYRIAFAFGVAGLMALVLIPKSGARDLGSMAARKPPAAATAAAGFQQITWDDLLPKDWDPIAKFKGRNMTGMLDSSPEAIALMSEVREYWDNAPTIPAMDGRAVRLPGYVVPLEASNGELREFLLVPYFGACIHTPPPPANQIIHVITDKPVKGFQTMSAVWVQGVLNTGRGKSEMGASGYRLKLAGIEAYQAKRP